MKDKYLAVIVGGGIAGPGCARSLTEQGIHDFVLVTENIIGRLPTSRDGQVNYGAFYVRADYKHILKYVSLKRRVRPSDVSFFDRNRIRGIFEARNLLQARGLIRLRKFLKRFHFHDQRLRRNSLQVSQVEALRRDPWLSNLYTMPANQLIRKLRIEFWVEHFVNASIRSTAFLDVRDVSAYHFSVICLPLIVPTYQYEFHKSRLIDPFRKQIIFDRVQSVGQEGREWKVRTASGRTLFADFAVIATHVSDAKKLIPIQEPVNSSQSAFMFHVSGTRKNRFGQRPLVMLPSGGDDIVLVDERNKTHLFYSFNSQPDLGAYFDPGYSVIASHHWNPPFSLGTNLIESDRGDGLFLIGDHNFFTLENAYTTGLYAAEQIVAGKKQRELRSVSTR